MIEPIIISGFWPQPIQHCCIGLFYANWSGRRLINQRTAQICS